MTNTNITVNLNTNTATKGKPGRRATVVNFPTDKSFTIKDVQSLNPNVKPITVRVNILRAVDNGTVTKLVKPFKSGKKGKPASKFILTDKLNELKANDNRKTVVTA